MLCFPEEVVPLTIGYQLGGGDIRTTLSPRTIDVVIGPVIDINQYDISTINELIEKTWNEMNNLLK